MEKFGGPGVRWGGNRRGGEREVAVEGGVGRGLGG